MPRSTLEADVSARYAAISPNSGSSGACGTVSAGKLVVESGAMCAEILCSLAVGEVVVEEEGLGGEEEEEEEEEMSLELVGDGRCECMAADSLTECAQWYG